ncbi:MAG: hypothetical protein AAF726_16290 [Planctomycetota bacterium]
MHWCASLLAVTCLQAGDAPPEQQAVVRPHLVLRLPDLVEARQALSTSAWSRLLADDQFTAGLLEFTGDPQATVSSLLAEARQGLRVDAPEVLEALDLLSSLRSVTVGAVVRPGDLDRPAREWRLASLLQHGHVVAVLEVSDPEAGQRWLEACARLFARPGFVDVIGNAETASDLDGTRLVLRLGARESAISVDSLEQALDSRIALPDAEGTVLADAWIAPFDEFHLHERPPEVIALSRLLRAIAGPQAWFFLGAGRSRVTMAADGTLSVDDARPILPIESGDFLGRSPVSRDVIELAHPEAFLALATSLDRDALAAAIAGIVGEEAASSFVAHLDDALAISMPPVRGIAQIPPVFLAARHSDREAVLDATARACDRAVASMATFASVERKEYRGAVLFTLRPERGSFPADAQVLEGLLRPTVAVLDDRIVATTAPAAMKKEIRRLQKDEGAHAGLSAVAAPKDASMVAYVDWGRPPSASPR